VQTAGSEDSERGKDRDQSKVLDQKIQVEERSGIRANFRIRRFRERKGQGSEHGTGSEDSDRGKVRDQSKL